MGSDPIVAEVRAVRERLAAECGNELQEIFRRARRYQVNSGVTCVRYAARRVKVAEDANVNGTDGLPRGLRRGSGSEGETGAGERRD